MQEYNTPEIQEAQKASQGASQNAVNYASAASLLPDKLKQAIQEKLNYNKDIIEQKNRAQSEYFAAPSAAREKYQDIWNPFQREALVSKARTNAYLPYANMVDIQNQRMGTIADIINAGTGAFGSAVTAAQGGAELARQNWADLITMADKNVSLRQWQIDNANSGSGGLGLNPKTPNETVPEALTPTEEKPKVSESQKQRMLDNPFINWRSAEGQWEYNFEYDDWVPAGVQVTA